MSTSRHTLYNLSGATISLVVALVTVPLYIHQIGEARYGVLAIVWMLLGYFGMFDLGLSRATAQAIAANHSAGSRKWNDIVWAGVFTNLGFGVLGGLILYLTGYWLLQDVLSVGPKWRDELLGGLPWMAAVIPVTTVTSIFSGTLLGLSRFFELSALSVLGNALFQIAPLIMAYIVGPDLRWLIPAAICARIIAGIPFAMTCVFCVPLSTPGRSAVEEVTGLLRFGAWVTADNIIAPLLDGVDRAMVMALAGAKAVTFYVVPMSLAQRLTIIPASISLALFPRYALGQTTHEARSHVQDSFLTVSALLTPVTCLAIIILPVFLTLWIGKTFSTNASLVGQILFVGMWTNGAALIPYARLQAIGRPDLITKIHALELVPFITCLWAAVTILGVPGAALAWASRAGVDMLLLGYAARLERLAFARLLPALSILAACVVIGRLPVDPFTAIILQFCLFALTMPICWWMAPRRVRRLLTARVKGFARHGPAGS